MNPKPAAQPQHSEPKAKWEQSPATDDQIPIAPKDEIPTRQEWLNRGLEPPESAPNPIHNTFALPKRAKSKPPATDEKAREMALKDVLRERKEQQHKWGEQNHDMPTWLAILHEETGELSEAVLHNKFGGPKRNNIFKESVQVAAVALQIVEFVRRKMNESRSQQDK